MYQYSAPAGARCPSSTSSCSRTHSNRPLQAYDSSFAVAITAHAPPTHSGSAQLHGGDQIEQAWLKKHEHLDAVLCRRPFEAPAPLKRPRTAKLVFIEPVRMTSTRGAQLFVCEVHYSDGSKPKRWMAKLFDPLYYPFFEEEGIFGASTWTDVTYLTDCEYANEAAMYTRLGDRHMTGFAFPEYGGSWTFDLPVPSTKGNEVASCVLRGTTSSCPGGCKHVLSPSPAGRPVTRPIRLILMEQLRGETMAQILDKSSRSKFGLGEEARMAIWAQFLHVQAHLYQANIDHGDIVPRNIMICSIPDPGSRGNALGNSQAPRCATCAGASWRVVVFDFGHAESWENCWLAQHFDRPINPMSFWEQFCNSDFHSWWPEWYEGDNSRRQSWLLENFGGDKAGRYTAYNGESLNTLLNKPYVQR